MRNSNGICGADSKNYKLAARARRPRAVITAALAACALVGSYRPALATDQTWDGKTTGGLGGASDTWNATDLDWLPGDIAWGSGGAIFGGTAGTVNIVSPTATPLSATGLTFNTTGYTLSSSTSGNTLMLASPGAGAAPSISLASGVTATIGAFVSGGAGPDNLKLGGNSGLIVSGGGTLILGNALSLTGGITVNSSTLAEGIPALSSGNASVTYLNGNALTLNNSSFTVNSTNSPFSIAQSIGNVTVGGNSTITMSRGNLAASSSINFSSSLIMSAGATVNFSMGGNTCTNGALIQFGGTTLNGDATFVDYEDPTTNASGTVFTGTNAPVGENGRLGIYTDSGHAATFLSGGSSTLAGTTVRISSTIANPTSASGSWTIGSSNASTPRGVSLDLNTTTGSVGGISSGAITVNPFSQLWLDGVGILTWGSSSQTISISGIGTVTPANAATSVYTAGATQPSGGALSMTSTTVTGLTNTLLSNVSMAAASSISVKSTNEIDGNITGTGPLTIVGGGTLNLGGTANTWTGGTIINNGSVVVNAGSSLSSSVGPLTLSSSSATAPTSTSLTLNVNQTVGTLSASFAASTGTASNTIKLSGVNLNIIQTANGTFGPGAVTGLTSTISDGAVAGGSVSLAAGSTSRLTLSGPNTYTGGTTLNAGSLLVTNTTGSATGTGAVVVNGAATLGGNGTITGAVTVNAGTINPGPLSGAGTLSLGGLTFSSSPSLSGTLNYDLNTPASSDLIALGSGSLTLGTVANTIPVNLTNLGSFGAGTYHLISFGGSLSGLLSSLFVNPANAPSGFGYTFANPSGFVDLVVTPPPTITWAVGNGVWDINTTPNWTGASTTFVNNDGVVFDDNNTGGSNIAVTIAAGGVSPSVVTFNNNSKSYTISGAPISGNASVNVAGTGLVTLASPNTFTGAVAVSGGGTLSINADNELGNSANNVSLTSASAAQLSTLQVTSTLTTARNVSLLTAGGAIDVTGSNTLTISGSVSGNGGLTKADTGTLILTGSTNSYAGNTIVNQGLLQLGAAGASPAQSALTVAAGATFDTQTFSNQVASIAGTGSILIGSGATLTAGSNNADTTFSGTITGTGGLAKQGSGTLMLPGVGNSFAGGLTLSGGGTVVGGTGGVGTGLITLGAGSTLQLTSSTFVFNGAGNPTLTTAVGGGKLVAPAGANITLPTLGGANPLAISGGGVTVTSTSTTAGGSSNLTIGTATDGGDTLVIGDTDSNGNIGITNVAGGAGGTITLRSGSTFYQNAALASSIYGIQIGFKQPTSGPAGTLGIPASLTAGGGVATGNGTLTLNDSTTWQASGFNAYSGGSPTVATAASITISVPNAGDTLIDNTAWRASTTADTAAVINVTGNGLYQICSGAITTTMYAGSWNINMGSTGKFVIANITGGTGETLNALGYNGSTGSGWASTTNPITLNGGTILFGADGINPGDSTPPVNLNSFRSNLTVTGPAAIASTGFEYSNSTTGSTGAILDTTPVAANIAGDVNLFAPLTVYTYDPLNPSAGSRNLNFSTNGLNVQGNFIWGGSTLTVDPGTTTGGKVSFGRTLGSISVSPGSILQVNAGSIVNLGFIPGVTGTTAISGLDPLTDSSFPTQSVAVVDNGVVAWGGRTSLAGDAGLGPKAYATASLSIGAGATAVLNAPDTLADRTILTSGPLMIDPAGKLDLTKNEVIATATPTAIRQALHAGQIVSSSGAVGYIDLGSGQTEMRYTLLGDTNLDGTVNVSDLGNLATNFGTTSGAFWAQGDFDYNGSVNVADLGDLATNFSETLGGFGSSTASADSVPGGSLAIAAAGASTAVPEPATMSLVVASVALLAGGRRRRRHMSR